MIIDLVLKMIFWGVTGVFMVMLIKGLADGIFNEEDR